MSEITLFENDEFRLEIQSDGADGFRVLAPPVARQLGYRDAARMLETVPDAEKGYTLASTPGGEQRVQWGVRYRHGLVLAVSSEREARNILAAVTLCRSVGPWVDAPAASGETS